MKMREAKFEMKDAYNIKMRRGNAQKTTEEEDTAKGMMHERKGRGTEKKRKEIKMRRIAYKGRRVGDTVQNMRKETGILSQKRRNLRESRNDMIRPK